MLCFAGTKCVPEDGWGSLSGGRLRNTFVCTGIILGSAAQGNGQFRHCFANVLAHSSSACCNSASADRIVVAASRLLGAAAACVILLLLQLDIKNRIGVTASRSRSMICQQIASILVLVIFLLKLSFKKCFEVVLFCFGVEILFWSCNFWRRCA